MGTPYLLLLGTVIFWAAREGVPGQSPSLACVILSSFHSAPGSPPHGARLASDARVPQAQAGTPFLPLPLPPVSKPRPL